jgi:hypothetical protein
MLVIEPSAITITSTNRNGWVTEWLIVHAWKACVPKGTGGSNPPPSATLHRADASQDRLAAPAGAFQVTHIHVELVV